jgi:hypothetical protein
VQRQLEELRQVEVARQHVRLLAEGAGLDAAAGPAFAGVLDALSLTEQLLHDRVGVEHGREPVAPADHLRGGPEEAIGRLARDLDVVAGLEDRHLVDDLQQQVGHLVDRVLAVARQAGEVDVGEVGVRPALGGGDAHLGRCGVVVELDPPALQELPGILARQRAVRQAALVEGPQVLVEVARVEGVPAVQLGDHREVTEPVHLQGFPEVPRGLRGHAAAHTGDALQLAAPRRARLVRGQLLGALGVALREADGRVGRDVHRHQLLAAAQRVRVAVEVQRRDRRRDVALEIEHPLAVDLPVGHRVAGGPLLHELREDPRVVGVPPLLRELGEHAVAERAAPPVRDDQLLLDAKSLLVDGVARLLAAVERPEVVDAVTRQLREGRRRLGGRSALAHDQLVRADEDRLVLAEVAERQGPHHRDGVTALVLAVELREEARPLHGDRGGGIEALLSKTLDAIVHAHPPTVTARPCEARRSVTARRCPSVGGSMLSFLGTASRSYFPAA